MAQEILLRALVVANSQTFKVFRDDYHQGAEQVAVKRSDPSIATATLSELTFRRWTSGAMRSLPQYPAPLILEHMYGYPARVLFGPADQVPPPALVPLFDESDIAMTARDAAAHASDAAALVVPDITLDQLDDDVIAVARAYTSTAPFEAHRKAKELLLVAQELLDRTQRSRQRDRLYLVAGQSAAIMSSACFDLGAFAPSVQLARTAALYGETREDGPLQAYAYGMLACLAYWDDRPAEALRKVQQAQKFEGLGVTAITRLAAIEARAYAHLGDHENAEKAVRKSLDPQVEARDELHDGIGGEFGFPAERLAMSNATTYLLLSDSNRAEDAATHALGLLAEQGETRPVLVTSQASIDLARARLIRGELAGAHEALNPVFDVPAEWRGTGIVKRLGDARAQLAQGAFRTAAEARTLGERIEEFTAVAAARTLSGSAHLAIDS
ncbi:hypothetical protein ABZ419_02970 [Streptomyces cinnamoneus]|uniref:hypothetical protein n=1 Tax=Streptomyces cinnamoneus TaxID=53446 RepID=UPI0033E122EB